MPSDLESDEAAQVGRSHSLAEVTERSSSTAVPISGFINALTGLETKIAHITHSTSAQLNLFIAAPLKTISLKIDQALTYCHICSYFLLFIYHVYYTSRSHD